MRPLVGSSNLKPLGVVLKEARNNKGVSLEDAYKAIRIHPKILQSLEDGGPVELADVYLKSYARSYALYLSIDVKEIDKYLTRKPFAEVKEKKKVEQASQENKHVDFGELYLKDGIQPVSYLNLKNILIGLSIFLLVVLFFKFAQVLKKSSFLSSRSAASGLKTKSAKVVKNEKKPNHEAVKKDAFPVIKDTLRLTIFAQEDTWMQVKVDDKVVFKRVLTKNTSETWQAEQGLELWLANAGTVKLELNGKVLSPIGRRGQLLKSVLITKEGLKINK